MNNAIGPVGAFVSDWMLSWFGYAAFGVAWVPMMVVRWIVRGTQDGRVWIARALGLILLIPGLCIVLGLHIGSGTTWLPIGTTGGGILGGVLNQGLVADFGLTGTALSGLALSVVGLTIVFSVSWPDVLCGHWIHGPRIGSINGGRLDWTESACAVKHRKSSIVVGATLGPD